DHRLAAGAAEPAVELGLLEGRVGGDDAGAERGDRVEGGDEPGVVAEDEADRVAGADPLAGEPVREPLDPLDQVGEAEPLVAVDDGGLVGTRLGLRVEQLQQQGGDQPPLRSAKAAIALTLLKFSGTRSSSPTAIPKRSSRKA